MSATLVLAACHGAAPKNQQRTQTFAGARGGTLYYLTGGQVNHLDPQRVYYGAHLTLMNRLFARGLVQLPASGDQTPAPRPVPDLATDTGVTNDAGRTWTFTLKPGVTWQDGEPVTCADLSYGPSRTFATDVITGGPSYILGYLPAVAKVYHGPYLGVGQAAYDQAVTCSEDNTTITYHFEKPWADFPLAIASLRCFDPYRKDQDKGDRSNLAVFSNGPYQLRGTWRQGFGGTFVRNPAYDPRTDGVRRALPDQIVVREGLTDEVVGQRLMTDSGNDRYAVTDRPVPPAFYRQIRGEIATRSVTVDGPYVFYLAPNFATMPNRKVRHAVAAATDRVAYATATGGETAAVPATSMVSPSIPGYRPNPAFTGPPGGDPATARKLLEEAGVTRLYPVRLAYDRTQTSDNAAAALKAGWDRAGFATTLVPLTSATYPEVSDARYTGADLILGGWGADWPSMSTVLPPLFDSRVNLGPTTNGQDFGNFDDDRANALMDRAASRPSLPEQQSAYQALDAYLGEQVAYIPLVVTRLRLVRGSAITNYVVHPASNNLPDLAVIGVQ